MNLPARNTQLINAQAQKMGFDFCGISQADFLEDQAPLLEQWLKAQNHGKMEYMARHFDKRLDPRKLVEGARSVISLLYNYYPQQPISPADTYHISKYAYGKDYHEVIRKKLHRLLAFIREEIGEVSGRVFVDSAPVMDKVWASRAGLGWVGKHTNLINRRIGSFFFIAEMILDIDLEADGPIGDYCGTCTRCLDACPTEALIAPYQIDARKCISYLTIELKEAIPDEFAGQMKDWIFGCDICQDVCPWNRFSTPHQEPDFEASDTLRSFKKRDWEEMTAEVFREVFKKSPVKRTKWEGLQRNIKFVAKPSGE